MEKNKISAGTLARTIILALALVNQVLVVFGISPIPIDDAAVETLISTGWTILAAVAAWWKNNSFSRAAIEADRFMQDMKKVN